MGYPAAREFLLPPLTMVELETVAFEEGQPTHLHCRFVGGLLSQELREACRQDLDKAWRSIEAAQQEDAERHAKLTVEADGKWSQKETLTVQLEQAKRDVAELVTQC